MFACGSSALNVVIVYGNLKPNIWIEQTECENKMKEENKNYEEMNCSEIHVWNKN